MKNQTYTIKVNEAPAFELNTSSLDQLDWVPDNTGVFHILKSNKSYKAEVVEVNTDLKIIQLKINGRLYHITIEDEYDRLIKKLGLSTFSSNKVNEVKAPMPGLVLEVVVKIGQEIKKGDGLLILEAMKMEITVAAPKSGTVVEIMVKEGDDVGLGDILVSIA